MKKIFVINLIHYGWFIRWFHFHNKICVEVKSYLEQEISGSNEWFTEYWIEFTSPYFLPFSPPLQLNTLTFCLIFLIKDFSFKLKSIIVNGLEIVSFWYNIIYIFCLLQLNLRTFFKLKKFPLIFYLFIFPSIYNHKLYNFLYFI